MSQDYLIGIQLDEYRLESLLGRGGMARVYRGVDVNLNRYVAIKVIDIPHRADEEYVQRFRREAQAIAQLDHPNIVRLYRFGEAQAGPYGDSVLYMAMQFIEGADLQYVLDSYRNDGEYIESKEARRIIREVCEALDYAHAKGIIHRDIKSSNIMLNKDGRAIVTDFGLAMLSTQATRGEIFGSPHYIAPEQAMSSAKAVPQSDLYAVGVILYEMFTGVLPFHAEEPLELALMHMTSPVPSPREIRPEISEELAAVMVKALEKRPEDRYPTGKALADALDEALLRKSPSLPPARMSIPERVTLGLSRQALPPLPPKAFTPPPKNTLIAETAPAQEAAPTVVSVQEAATDLRPVSQTIIPGYAGAGGRQEAPSGVQSPVRREQNRLFWAAGGIAGLLVFFLCLVLGGTILYSQLIPNSRKESVAVTPTQETPTHSVTQVNTDDGLRPQPTATLEPVQTPTHTPTPTPKPVTYKFQIHRRGEDKGYLVITNTGSMEIPAALLTLQTDKARLDGSVWGVDQIAPGECVLARKKPKGNGEKEKGKAKEEEVNTNNLGCDSVGIDVQIERELESIFKERLTIYYEDEPVGGCGKDQQLCGISFTK